MDDHNISEKWTAFAAVLAHGINNSEIRCKSSRGLLYAVTSNLLNGIKVGFWRGSHTRLLGRYRWCQLFWDTCVNGHAFSSHKVESNCSLYTL